MPVESRSFRLGPVRLLTAVTIVVLVGATAPFAGADDLDLPCVETATLPNDALCGTWVEWPDMPAPRAGHQAVHDATDSLMLVHGGVDATGTPSGDLFAFNYLQVAWTTRAPGPAVTDHALGHDPAANQLWVFGGRDADGAVDGLWRYDVATDVWTQVASTGTPSPRYGVSGAWDTLNGRLLVFGGTDGTDAFGDLYAFDPETATWSLGANAPAARAFAVGAWDVTRQALMVHGGESGGAPLSDAWLYTPANNQWMALEPSTGERAHHAGVWDTTSRNLVVFAGHEGTGPSADSWAFSPHLGVWVRQDPVFAAVQDAAAVWNGLEAKAYIAGGAVDGVPTDAFWWFTPALATRAI